MTENRFLHGTLILLATSLLLKVMGFIYQIAIIRLVGTEPVGLLNMTYPFYIAFVVLATAGIPLAIAKIIAAQSISGNQMMIRRTMRLSFLLVLGLGSAAFLFSLLTVPLAFQYWQKDWRMVWCFYVLLPGIVIVPISSIIRGYFQGIQQMIYPSIAQIAEQIVRLSAGIILVIILKPFGVRFVAMGLAGGMIIGELAGMLLILFFYLYSRKKQPLVSTGEQMVSTQKLLGEIASLGVPTTLSKLTSSIDMAVEASLIPYCLLQVGFNHSQAASVYGQFSGVAMTLLTIPTILTGALSTALVPSVSEANARGQQKEMQRRCSEALRITYIFSMPIIVVLFFQGENLAKMLFHLEGLGIIMQILSLGAIFLYLGQTTIGIMQGLGMTKAVFVNNLLASVAKLICIYYFSVMAKTGMIGIALSFVLSYVAQCLLNLLMILRQVDIRFSWQQIVAPVFLCSIMLLYLRGFQLKMAWLLNGNGLLLGAIVSAGMIYFLLLLLTKQFSLNSLKS